MNLSKRYSYNKYKNSIKRIDNNINDIRNDINDMKKKTENAFDILIQSLKNSQNANSFNNIKNNNIENFNDNNNKEINNENNKNELKLNESYEINLLKENLEKEKILKRNSSQTEIPSLILNKYNKKFFNYNKNNDNSYNNISNINSNINSIGYELEILKLKKEIKCLKTKRLILQSTLNKKKQENIDVNLMINNYKTGPNGNILINIIKLLNLSNNNNNIFDFDEFKEKIKEINLKKENLNLINEFIKGLNEIFINFYKDNNNNNINYENIYNMILNIIKNINELKLDNENFIEGLNILNKEKKEYEIFCKNLMNDLQCKNFFELKEYIKELIIRDKYNKKQVDILKNILK